MERAKHSAWLTVSIWKVARRLLLTPMACLRGRAQEPLEGREVGCPALLYPAPCPPLASKPWTGQPLLAFHIWGGSADLGWTWGLLAHVAFMAAN